MMRGLVRARYAAAVLRRRGPVTVVGSVAIGVVATSSFGSAWRVRGDSILRRPGTPNRRVAPDTRVVSGPFHGVHDPCERGTSEHEDHHQPHPEEGRRTEHRDRSSEGAQGGLDRPRRAGRRHRPRPRRRRRAEGRQRPPRHRDEPGARGLPPVPERHDARPVRPHLARPRPVRPVLRALLAHPVHPAVPQRVRPRAERPQVAAHLGLAHPRPPRGAPHQGRRDHHRPARLGPRLRRRHGDGAAPPARPARPRRQARHLALRPPRVGPRLRRRPHGGRGLRGLLARRPPGARQPHRRLRREPDLDRGRHRHLVQRGRREALPRPTAGRSSTSTGAARTTRPAPPTTSRTSTPSSRPSRRAAPRAQADPRPPPHRHRLARPERARHRQVARLGPRRRRDRGHQGAARLRPEEDLRGRQGRPQARPRGAGPAARPPTRRGTRPTPRGARPTPTAPPSSTALVDGELPDGLREVPARLRHRRQGHRHARRLGQGPRRPGRRPPRAVGWLRRPRRVEQHDDGRRALVHPQGQADRTSGRAAPTAAPCTSASARTRWA